MIFMEKISYSIKVFLRHGSFCLFVWPIAAHTMRAGMVELMVDRPRLRHWPRGRGPAWALVTSALDIGARNRLARSENDVSCTRIRVNARSVCL